MNKLVLEKLLHTYKAIGVGNKKRNVKIKSVNGKLVPVDPVAEKFMNKHWSMPTHINSNMTVGEDMIHSFFKNTTKRIQRSAKFHIDMTEQSLTGEEMQKLQDDVPFLLPYDECFLQINLGSWLHNLICVKGEQEVILDDGTTHDGFVVHCWNLPYEFVNKSFMFEPNCYTFLFHNNQSYTYWCNENDDSNPFAKYTDFTKKEDGDYRNTSLEEWANIMATSLQVFSFYLHLTSVVKSETVKGVKPQIINSPSSYKTSDLIMRPTWEHKTLKLDLYQNSKNGNYAGVKRSNGTAFHSVRSHLRKLPTGKHTFVKPHFRGSKEVGVIQKDYEVKV